MPVFRGKIEGLGDAAPRSLQKNGDETPPPVFRKPVKCALQKAFPPFCHIAPVLGTDSPKKFEEHVWGDFTLF